DAADDLAFSVQFSDATPLVGSELDPGDILQKHRCAVPAVEHHLLQVGNPPQIPLDAHHELGLAELDHAPAHITVAVPDRGVDLGQRNAIGLQFPWTAHTLILLDEAADRGHLGDCPGSPR